MFTLVVLKNFALPWFHSFWALSALRYLMKKALTIRIQIDWIGEKFWKGLPWKRLSDVLDKLTRGLVYQWWETTTIMSPNFKDVRGIKLMRKNLKTTPPSGILGIHFCDIWKWALSFWIVYYSVVHIKETTLKAFIMILYFPKMVL